MKDRSTLQADVVGLLLDLYGFSFGFQNCIISLPNFLHTSLGGQLSLQVRSRDAACRLDRLVVQSPFFTDNVHRYWHPQARSEGAQ